MKSSVFSGEWNVAEERECGAWIGEVKRWVWEDEQTDGSLLGVRSKERLWSPELQRDETIEADRGVHPMEGNEAEIFIIGILGEF